MEESRSFNLIWVPFTNEGSKILFTVNATQSNLEALKKSIDNCDAIEIETSEGEIVVLPHFFLRKYYLVIYAT